MRHRSERNDIKRLKPKIIQRPKRILHRPLHFPLPIAPNPIKRQTNNLPNPTIVSAFGIPLETGPLIAQALILRWACDKFAETKDKSAKALRDSFQKLICGFVLVLELTQVFQEY